MKTIISILLLACISLSANANTPFSKGDTPSNLLEGRFEKAKPCTIRINLLIHGFPSKTKNPCTGLGFRCLKLEFNKPLSRLNPNENNPGYTQMMFEQLSNEKVKITFPSNQISERHFSVMELVDLPKVVAKSFGYSSVSVLKGDYKIINNNK